MRKLTALLTLFLAFLVYSPTSYADDCSEDPHACFDGFEDDGSIITKDGDAERTFSFPPVKVGFIIDLNNPDILPHISLEVAEFEVPHAGDFSLDVGVATSRLFGSLTWEFLPLIKAGPSAWFGYNVRENDIAFGVGLSILEF